MAKFKEKKEANLYPYLSMKYELISVIVLMFTKTFQNKGDNMDSEKVINSDGFMPIYKEITDIIGVENTYALYKSMRGLQITLPKKLYTNNHILSMITDTNSDEDLRKIALEYNYTEKYLRQLLKQREKSDCS
jgi:hypothetical protein